MNDSMILLRLPARIAEKVSVLFDHQAILDGDVIDAKIQAGGSGSASVIHGGYLPKDVAQAIRAVLPEVEDTTPLEAALSLWSDDLSWRDAQELKRAGDLLWLDPETVPRLTRRLAIERSNAAAGWAAASAIEYRCVREPSEYAFRIHNEEFHATRVRLPTAVEAHRGALDLRCLYMVGDVRDELVVHDVPFSQPRPAPPTPKDGVGASGVTAFMASAKADRVRPASAEARRFRAGIASIQSVQGADEMLHAYKVLLAQKATAGIAFSKTSGMITEFTHETVVDAPAWLDHHPEVRAGATLALELTPGEAAPFRASAQRAQERAFQADKARADREAALQANAERMRQQDLALRAGGGRQLY